jgi:hypothetical protein
MLNPKRSDLLAGRGWLLALPKKSFAAQLPGSPK